MASRIPESRRRPVNGAPVRDDGRYVLYWMTAQRRTTWNFALQRAVEWARELKRPLVVLEALRAGYPFACDRFHRFVMDGMEDNAQRFEKAGVRYHAYVEPAPGKGSGLVEALAGRACVVVADDHPGFFLPRMLDAAGRRLKVRCEAVDGCGLLPLRSTEQIFPTAYAFRRFVHRSVADALEALPVADPLRGLDLPAPALPRDVLTRWPAGLPALESLPIDHRIAPVEARGGPKAAARALDRFVGGGLERYAEHRNHPDADVTSGLSPYLHFGHIAPHEIFRRVAAAENWTPERLARDGRGQRAGFWKMSESAEGFLDQLVTWRELGFHTAAKLPRYDRFETLPGWAQRTLAQHAGDPRRPRYRLEDFEAARTHDALWNAAQTQLCREGVIHNYLRMLWGKKILQWTASPREALDVMLTLNDRWALDGRDPNSVSGIFWCLGRYDRPWGPERPVFGTVRYMTSENTARKVRLKAYVARFQGAGATAARS